jgi:hypothetical protein
LRRLREQGAVEGDVFDAAGAYASDLAVREERHALRLGQYGGEVARDVHLAVPVADDDAAGVTDARSQDTAGFLCR